MSDRRAVLRGRFVQFLPINNVMSNLSALRAALAGRLSVSGNKVESYAHLAPISLTPVVPLDLPAANRNSA